MTIDAYRITTHRLPIRRALDLDWHRPALTRRHRDPYSPVADRRR